MADIQSATADIRRGKKKKQGQNIMSASATQGGHNNYYSLSEEYTRSSVSVNS